MVKLVERDYGAELLITLGASKPGAHLKVYGEHTLGPRKRFVELLGYVLAQAVGDGMHGVLLAADLPSGLVEMRYFRDTPRGDESWAMTAPPAEAYIGLLQAIVDATRFRPGVTPSGELHARVNGKYLIAKVEFAGWSEVVLSWLQ